MDINILKENMDFLFWIIVIMYFFIYGLIVIQPIKRYKEWKL